MSEDAWTEKSRYGALRTYTVIVPDQIKLICHDVLYCSFGGSPDHITSIDPDGGPYLSIGQIIRSYRIQKISYSKSIRKSIKILLQVIHE